MKYQVLTDYLNKHARDNAKYEIIIHSFHGVIYKDKLVRMNDTDSYDDIIEFSFLSNDHIYVDDDTFKLDAELLSILNAIMNTPRSERLNKKQSLMDDINQNINKLYENQYKQDMTKQEFLKLIKEVVWLELTIILFSTIILLMIAEIIGFNIYCSKVVGYNVTIRTATFQLICEIIFALLILLLIIFGKCYSADDIMCYTAGFVGTLIGGAMINTDYW